MLRLFYDIILITVVIIPLIAMSVSRRSSRVVPASLALISNRYTAT